MKTPWFGLFLPQLRMTFPTILERTLAAEAAGFDSVWLMDHLAAPMAPEVDTFEGWTTAAASRPKRKRVSVPSPVCVSPDTCPVCVPLRCECRTW